jgi:hypothetical protein
MIFLLLQLVTISENISVFLSQAVASKHYNFSTSSLLLLGGRTREAWEPPNETMLYPPSNIISVTSLMAFHFHLLLCYNSFSLPDASRNVRKNPTVLVCSDSQN